MPPKKREASSPDAVVSEWQVKYEDAEKQLATLMGRYEGLEEEHETLKQRESKKRMEERVREHDQLVKQREEEETKWFEEKERRRLKKLDADRLLEQNLLILRQETEITSHMETAAALRDKVEKMQMSDTAAVNAKQQDTISRLYKRLYSHLMKERATKFKHNKIEKFFEDKGSCFRESRPKTALCIDATCFTPLGCARATDDMAGVAELLRRAGYYVCMLMSHWGTNGADKWMLSPPDANASEPTRANILQLVASYGLGTHKEQNNVLWISCIAFRHADLGLLLVPSDGRLPCDYKPLRRNESSTATITPDLNLISLLELYTLLTATGIPCLIIVDSVSPVLSRVKPGGGIIAVVGNESAAFQYSGLLGLCGSSPKQPYALLYEQLKVLERVGGGGNDFVSALKALKQTRRWPVVPIDLETVLPKKMRSVLETHPVVPGSVVLGTGLEVPQISSCDGFVNVTVSMFVDSAVTELFEGVTEPTSVTQRGRRNFPDWFNSYLCAVVRYWQPDLLSAASAVEYISASSYALAGCNPGPFLSLPYDMGAIEITVRGQPNDPKSSLNTLLNGTYSGRERWSLWSYHETRVDCETVLVVVFTKRPPVLHSTDVITIRCAAPDKVLRDRYKELDNLNGHELVSLRQGVQVDTKMPRAVPAMLDSFMRASSGRMWDARQAARYRLKNPFQLFVRKYDYKTIEVQHGTASEALYPDMNAKIWFGGRPEDAAAGDGWLRGAVVEHVKEREMYRVKYETGEEGEVKQTHVRAGENEEAWAVWAAMPEDHDIKKSCIDEHEKKVKESMLEDDGECDAVLHGVTQQQWVVTLNSYPPAEFVKDINAGYVVVFIAADDRPSRAHTAVSRMRCVAKRFMITDMHVTTCRMHAKFFVYYLHKDRGPCKTSVPHARLQDYLSRATQNSAAVIDKNNNKAYLLLPCSAVLLRNGLFDVAEYQTFVSAVLNDELRDLGTLGYTAPVAVRGMHVTLL